jgi:trimeric autotransporter adhesin
MQSALAIVKQADVAAMTDAVGVTAVASTADGSYDMTSSTNGITQPLAQQQMDTSSSGISFDTEQSASTSVAAYSMSDVGIEALSNTAENLSNTAVMPRHTTAAVQQACDEQAVTRGQQSVAELGSAALSDALTVSTTADSNECTATTASTVGTIAAIRTTVEPQQLQHGDIYSTDQTAGVKRAVCDDSATVSATTAASVDDSLHFSSSSNDHVVPLVSEQHAAQQQPTAKCAKTAHADTDFTSTDNTTAELTADSNVCVSSSNSGTANTTAVSHSVVSTLHTDSASASSGTLNMIGQSQAVVTAIGGTTYSTDTSGTANSSTQCYNGSDMDTQLTSNLMLLMSNTRAGHFTEQFRVQQAETLVTAWNAGRHSDVCVKLEMLKFWCAYGHIDEQFRRAQAEQAWAYYVQQQQQL